jgi:ribosomal protein S18 acetylase RimI-like enzyme
VRQYVRVERSCVDVVKGRQDPAAIERLLRALPDWFGIEESVQEYVEDARTKPTYLAVDVSSGEVLGVLVVTSHNPQSAEVHLLAVAPDHHRQGIGRTLVTAFEADMAAAGVRVLQVKTQGPSRPDEGYDKTLRFYLAMGYIPLEEIHGLWAENPCLILVKPL